MPARKDCVKENICSCDLKYFSPSMCVFGDVIVGVGCIVKHLKTNGRSLLCGSEWKDMGTCEAAFYVRCDGQKASLFFDDRNVMRKVMCVFACLHVCVCV